MQLKSAGLRAAFVTPVELKFAADNPGQFEGYAATFGNQDLGGDVIAKGAFRDTLRDWKKRKRLPPMLLNHGGFGAGATDDLPIGIFGKMEEDDIGLRVEGELIALDTDLGKRIYAAMQAKAIDGMSIGYRAKEFAVGTKPSEPRRTLKKIDLIEVSVVTFPMNPQARIGQSKGPSIRDCELALRDAGLSREEAKTVLARGYAGLGQRDAGAAGEDGAALERLLASIQAGVQS